MLKEIENLQASCVEGDGQVLEIRLDGVAYGQLLQELGVKDEHIFNIQDLTLNTVSGGSILIRE